MTAQGAQEFSTDVAASVDDCFATVLDFARYPDWSSTVESTRVLATDADGRAHQVELKVNITIKTVRYVLEYEYDPPTHISWHAIAGDLEAIEGAYTFKKLKAKQTRVTCRQAVAVGFWVPGPIRTMIERTALQQSVLEFKAAAEARAASKPSTRRPATRR